MNKMLMLNIIVNEILFKMIIPNEILLCRVIITLKRWILIWPEGNCVFVNTRAALPIQFNTDQEKGYYKLSKKNQKAGFIIFVRVSSIINLDFLNSVVVLLGSMFGYKLCSESADGSRMLKWLNAKCQLSNEKQSGAVSGRPDQMPQFD